MALSTVQDLNVIAANIYSIHNECNMLLYHK